MSADVVIMQPENDDESEAGSPILIREEADSIVIRPAEATVPAGQSNNLDALLEAITPENLHGEWQTGPAVGREEW